MKRVPGGKRSHFGARRFTLIAQAPFAQMPQAPIVVRHGHTLIYCNDPAMVPAILQQLAPQDTKTDDGELATIAKNMLQVAAQHSSEQRARSSRDVLEVSSEAAA